MTAILLMKANTSEARLAHFDGSPSWPELSSKVAQMFSIPQKDVGVAYVDKAGVSVTVRNDQDLGHYYRFLESFEQMKFVVQNLRIPDGEPFSLSAYLPLLNHPKSLHLGQPIRYSLINSNRTLNHYFR